MVGKKYEAGGIAKDGAKMVMAVANAKVRLLLALPRFQDFHELCIFVQLLCTQSQPGPAHTDSTHELQFAKLGWDQQHSPGTVATHL